MKSILPRDEPAIWHEAAATLPTLPVLPAGQEEEEAAVVQAQRAAAERLLQQEEQVGAQYNGISC